MKSIQIAIFHGLGDCVNVTTFLKPIKTKFPGCKVTWITYEGYKDLVKYNPYVDEVISFADKGGKPGFACDKRYPALKKKYPNLIIPASYMTGIQGDGTLLGSFKHKLKRLGVNPNPFTPLLFVTPQENQEATDWLINHDLDNYVILEATYGSSQSPWSKKDTEKAIKTLGAQGFQVLLTHRKEPLLEKYREWADVKMMDVHYRYAPSIYNKSRGFIGVSSGISCIVHTHQCRDDIPHLEFVRGAHWSTGHYKKKNKNIITETSGLERLLRTSFPS